MRWFRNIFGEWLAADRTIAARLAERYVNDPSLDAAWFERALDAPIRRYGHRTLAPKEGWLGQWKEEVDEQPDS